MTTLTAPLVGAFHRPPARGILSILPANWPLLVRPEPTNAFDPNAVMVLAATPALGEMASLDEAISGYGYTREQVLAEPFLQLGYIARQQAPGWATILRGREWPVRLGFDVAGKETVTLDLNSIPREG